MPKFKKPDYYKTPLKKRSDIAEFILASTTNRWSDNELHPFCFNVKCHDADFSFEHLLELHKVENNNPVYALNEEWLAAVRQEYNDLNQDRVSELAFDEARDYVHETGGSFHNLYDGTNPDITYEFVGRSGGWLSIAKFEGFKFTDRNYDFTYWKEVLNGEPEYDGATMPIMSYKTLRLLYATVTMLKHDVRHKAIKSMLESEAEQIFFEQICSDIPRPNEKQLLLEFSEV